ncbi:hypothetical protein N0V82_002559 [Gnomoniopsis sp. IMI 355080]|nr:hypothetical protein N0V82_002559 [Gnomoniopsis sp. IMI 355080]
MTKLNVGDIEHPDLDREPPVGGYPQGDDDARVVVEILKPLVDAGKSVLLMAHSAGGFVATEAALSELQLKVRAAKGLSGGIIGIFFMGAFVIPIGESKHGYAGLGSIVEAKKYLFNDLGSDEANKWEAKLVPSTGLLTAKLTNNAYSALPCAYLMLDGDLTLPKDYQESMVALQASKTGEFTMYHSPAGHSPHLSWTEGVADTAMDFVRKIHA